jgi:hypothetical protein
MKNEANSAEPRGQGLSPPFVAVWLIVSWLWVGVPLCWGVYNTGVNAMKLFEKPAAAPQLPAKTAPPS